MSDELIQKILDYIRQTGEAVTTKGFELALRQVTVDAISAGILMILGIGAVFLAVKLAKIAINESRKRGSEQDEIKTTVGGIASVILGVIGPLVALVNTQVVINAIFNPEWVAVHMLLRLVK